MSTGGGGWRFILSPNESGPSVEPVDTYDTISGDSEGPSGVTWGLRGSPGLNLCDVDLRIPQVADAQVPRPACA